MLELGRGGVAGPRTATRLCYVLVHVAGVSAPKRECFHPVLCRVSGSWQIGSNVRDYIRS